MNEELQAAVTEIINSTISAKDFLVGQLPDYVEQLLMWHAVYSLVTCILGFLLAAAICYVDVRIYRYMKSHEFEDWQRCDAYLGMAIGSVVLMVPAMLMVNITWLKILIAPKVWLVEYAASLVR